MQLKTVDLKNIIDKNHTLIVVSTMAINGHNIISAIIINASNLEVEQL